MTTFRRATTIETRLYGLGIGLLLLAAIAPPAAMGATPADAAALKCENGAAKQLKKLLGCVGTCQVKAATLAFKGAAFDATACTTGPTPTHRSCLEKYVAANANLAQGQCPPCLDLAGIGASALNAMNAFNNDLYCSSATSTYPAPHPPLPQIVTLGGPVLASPHLHPVTFAGEDPTRAATLADFLVQLAGSTHWTATTAEYGVGALTVAPTIALTENPSAPVLDDSDVQAWLAAKLNADDPAFPTVDANSLFVLFYPAGVAITIGGAQSCQEFVSYHGEVQLDAAHASRVVAYAVVPSCAQNGNLMGIDATTAAASHAIVEAVTDPFALSTPAFGQTDADHLSWALLLGGGEVCDLCAQEPSSFVTLAASPYVVQRCWSNAAAAASHDPCVPAPAGATYFNAAFDLPDDVAIPGFGTTKGVKIPIGTSRTIPVDLWSDAATSGPITVSAFDPFGGNFLSFAFDNTQGVNGDVLNLTVTAAHSFSSRMFFVKATVGSATHIWVGIVTP